MVCGIGLADKKDKKASAVLLKEEVINAVRAK